MTKNVLNLILLIIVITLITMINFSQEKTTELDKLSNKNITSLSSIIISRNNNKVVINKQNENNWEITQPISVSANDFRINSLLKIINAPVHSQYSVNEIDLQETGLKNSTTLMQLDQTNIKFGLINPVTNLRYIQANEKVYTIEDVYYPLINSHHSTLVSLSLLPAESQIEKLVLPELTIQQDENKRWQSNPTISADTVSDILILLKSGQAFGVHEYIQRKNLGDVTIYLKNTDKPLHFIITDTDPWLILARPDIGLEYHLEIESHIQLIKPAD